MAKKEPQSCITTPYKTTCGGQALIEGIMMQGPDRRAVVVRKPDGELDVTTWEVESRKSIWRLPFLRGLKTFCSSMYHGIKALMYSADVSGEMEVEDEELTGLDKWINDHFSDEKASALIIGIAAVLGVAFSIGLFILLPTAVTGLIGLVWKTMPLWFRSVLEGIIKVAIFMGYLFLCSRMKEIHRVFEYHGAEHKCINCIEHGLPLTVDNVRISSRQHKRCGTSFLFFVLAISIILLMLIQVESPLMRVIVRIALIPVIAGISYEVLKLAGRSENPIINLLSRPGLAIQKLTTKEPDDSMIEVAIQAVEAVFDWRAYEAENFKTAEDL